MKHLFIVFLFLVTSSAHSAARHKLHYSDAYTLDEKAYNFNIGFTQWTSRGRYDVDGVEETFPSGEEFQVRELNFLTEYGMSQNFTIGVGGRWRQNTSFSEEEDLSISGLESLVGQLKYQFKPPSKRWRFTVIGSYRQTLYSNPSYDVESGLPENEDLVLGDSGTEYRIIGNLTYENTVNHYMHFWGGYNQPGNDLSAEVIYGAESAYPYQNWMFSFGIKGIYSLGFDEFESDPELKPLQQTGVSNLFNSTNRSNIGPFVKIARGYNNWRLIFDAFQVTDGFSTDEGFELGVKIQMRIPGKTKQTRKLNKFKEYLVETSIVKASPRGKFFKVDKGLAHDIEKGMSFDIFKSDYFGGNILVASGVVFEIGAEWAIIRINQRFRKMEIRPGFVARGY